VSQENGYHSCAARKTLWVNAIDRSKRLEFVKQYFNKTEEYWNTVILDENKFNIFGFVGRYDGGKKSKLDAKKSHMVKHDDALNTCLFEDV